jgi:galactose-1-phosphate uridylyltransferase
MREIAELDRYVAALPAAERALFERILALEVVEGGLVVPESMAPWVGSTFGSLQAVRHQRIVKLTNLITVEGALFNPLRAQRPSDAISQDDVAATIEATRGGPFCHPEELTPEDVFGRVRGKYCVTASNVAKYDGLHGLVVFDEHDPLQITPDRVQDYIQTALRWAKKAHNADVSARYFFLMWNCLWTGGSSIVHGHMQVALGRGMHYAHVERWRRQALLYRLAHGANYFEDLYRVHDALGLARRVGETRVFASLTPVSEKELVLISPTRWLDNDDMIVAIGRVLDRYTHRLGTQSFNLVLFQRPIDAAEEDWTGFPALVRIIDRGEPQARATDIGCMELFGSSVIKTDPYRVIEALDTIQNVGA